MTILREKTIRSHENTQEDLVQLVDQYYGSSYGTARYADMTPTPQLCEAPWTLRDNCSREAGESGYFIKQTRKTPNQ